MTSSRRDQLLSIAAALMAERGYHGVSIYDIGAAAGISGPALYRHFASKQEILGDLLTKTSERILLEGRRRCAAADSPHDALRALVEWHVEFALDEPNLLRIHDRDFASLTPAHRHQAQAAQREYIEIWAEQLVACDPARSPASARAVAQACFGLINSTPHSAKHLPRDQMAALLRRLAMAVLNDGLEDEVAAQ